MSDFVKEENVFVGQSAQSREEVLRFLADRAGELGIMGETGMTEGFAVPHAKSAAIDHAAVIVFKNDVALEWPSFDGQPVDIAMALLVPDSEAGTTHIKLLSKTAVLLMREEFKELLRTSDDRQAIADAINAGIES